jgi:hypothetical protein
MVDEPHEVVKLLLARMESHPEEFRVAHAPFHDRWYEPINGIHAYGNEADKAAIAAKLRDIRLDEIHERVMDEMLNGEDRRRKAEEDREYERNLIMQKARNTTMQQGGGGGGGGGGGASLPVNTSPYHSTIVGTSASSIWLDEHVNTGTTTAARYPTSTDMKNNGIVGALRKLVS